MVEVALLKKMSVKIRVDQSEHSVCDFRNASNEYTEKLNGSVEHVGLVVQTVSLHSR